MTKFAAPETIRIPKFIFSYLKPDPDKLATASKERFIAVRELCGQHGFPVSEFDKIWQELRGGN